MSRDLLSLVLTKKLKSIILQNDSKFIKIVKNTHSIIQFTKTGFLGKDNNFAFKIIVKHTIKLNK